MRSDDTWDPVRQAVMYRNEFGQCLGRLVGLCEGLICDQELSDDEIYGLRDWLRHNDAVAYGFPGDVIAARVKDVLADGVITEAERSHLIETLRQLLGGRDRIAAEELAPIELDLDEPDELIIPGAGFCFTGEFVFGPRDICERAVLARGGIVKNAVSRKVRYLVVGTLGSIEWKHGCFGTKIDKAIAYRRSGLPIEVIKENCWKRGLDACPAPNPC